MLFKLSLKNIKKSIKDYSIYFFTLVVAVAIFYIFNSLDAQQSMLELSSAKKDIAEMLVELIDYVSVFVTVILGFLIVYSNNFLIKRRKKEFGLYLTLGMSKLKVSIILFLETIMVGLISLIVGLVLGVVLSQFISVFVARLFEVNMSQYKFIFSSAALFKTILYFGIIFGLVMILNFITISKQKVIDLIHASLKNEKVRFRNKYFTFITFVLALLLLGYAYKLLFAGTLFRNGPDNDVIWMLVCGAVGTFFLFFSISGFFLKLFQLNKKVYFKNLNMFVLKQVNSKVNTTVISTTIISLMLLLTIGILSGSLSLINALNNEIRDDYMTDFSLISAYNEEMTERKSYDFLVNQDRFKESVDEYVIYTIYNTNSVTLDDLLIASAKKQFIDTYGENAFLGGYISIMLESDYQKIMKLYGDKYIDIKDDEALLLANVEEMIDYYNMSLKEGITITIDNTDIDIIGDSALEISILEETALYNEGILVISDKYKDVLFELNVRMIGNYFDNKEECEDIFKALILDLSFGYYATKLDIESTAVGFKAVITFIGLYLGIIFAVSSATVLAIGQLSESSDNKDRYRILKQIGADNKMIDRALFSQIAVAFLLPLVVALIHSYFGLRELNGTIKLLGQVDLTSNIIITTLFIVFVYGGYFMATYWCSRGIIKD